MTWVTESQPLSAALRVEEWWLLLLRPVGTARCGSACADRPAPCLPQWGALARPCRGRDALTEHEGWV